MEWVCFEKSRWELTICLALQAFVGSPVWWVFFTLTGALGWGLGEEEPLKGWGQAWSVVDASLCILLEGRNLISQLLFQQYLFQSAGSVNTLVAPREGSPQMLSGGPHGQHPTSFLWDIWDFGKCIVLTKNSALEEICYILFTKECLMYIIYNF